MDTLNSDGVLSPEVWLLIENFWAKSLLKDIIISRFDPGCEQSSSGSGLELLSLSNNKCATEKKK